MENRQIRKVVDNPLEATTSSESLNEQTSFSPSPSRGGSSSESFPFYFHHRDPTAAAGPGSDFGPISLDGPDIVYPIRSLVNISRPPPGPDSPAGSSSLGSPTGEGLPYAGSGSQPRPRETSMISGLDGGSSTESLAGGKGASGNFGGIPASGQSPLLSTVGESVAGGGMFRSVSESSDKNPRYGTSPGGSNEGYVTARFKHLVTDEGHMVITGVSGSESIRRCEDEPIRIPGAVQGFGVLIALKDVDGRLGVKIVSENSEKIIGYSPAALFALDGFCDILSEEQAESLYEHLDFVREYVSVHSGPDVFPLAITSPNSTEIKLWCAVHIAEKSSGLLICEFELEDDHIYPLFSRTEEETLPPPEDTLNSTPSEQDLLESTLSGSKPLRVLRHARGQRGQVAAMEVFNLMSQIQGSSSNPFRGITYEEQFSSASTLDVFLRVVVGIIKELTGFHRVMIYRFDEVWNGQVVTELVDPRATKDLYKGLNFPASDIPKQARDLYLLNKVRLLYDRDQVTARLVCKSKEYLDDPLDMTHSYLRAMSPIHIKYLENMAVRASTSISLTAFDKLWGLISCHSYGQKGMRVSFPIRKMCRLIGENASRNIERLSYASRLQARKLINTVPTGQNPSGYIIASSDDLLKLFDVDFGLLSICEETKVLGQLEHSQESLAMLEYLRVRKFTSVLTSQNIIVDFPDLSYEPGFSIIAGLLLVPLSVGGQDFIVFFRKGQLWKVNWAGNPYEKNAKEGTKEYLEPRKSFKTWSETVVGRSRDWTEEQVETAAVLCLIYGKFIEVWRQKEAALQASQLTRLLLANASHEGQCTAEFPLFQTPSLMIYIVRTPLNAIINYLEIALESPLDDETRDNLMRSHSASKSLIYVINDLLDLTRTEAGQVLIMEEAFDLSETVRDATERYKSDAERKSITFEVIECEGLPRFVKGDQARLRQAVSNIVGNAIKHTLEGGVRVEISMPQVVDGRCQIEVVVQDTGVGMSSEKLEALFREFEQVHTEEEDAMNRQEAGGDRNPLSTSFNALSKVPGQKVLGLGLAVVARIVRNMNGQLRLKSERGNGSRFSISLPFSLLSKAELDSEKNEGVAERQKSLSPQPSSVASTPGQVSLIGSQNRVSQDVGKKNGGSDMDRLGSFCGAKSGGIKIDRFAHGIPSLHLDPPPNNPPAGPGAAIRARSSPNTMSFATPQQKPSQEMVDGSDVPIKALTVSDENSSPTALPAADTAPLIELPPTANPNSPTELPEKYEILVAEDDPINSKIIKKRLEKMGHGVVLTVNGEECADLYSKYGQNYDIVLMDMQMPIMDGGTSTTRIRQFEGADPSRYIPKRHRIHCRVPIFAVSASLAEERLAEYIDFGFDGWIPKPINFGRLKSLLDGIRDPAVRAKNAYEPGHLEHGGWFSRAPGDAGPSPQKHEDVPAALRTQGEDLGRI
ncbi:unnamed protein product [Tuber aestivum]|uniref:Phytochrome n=1 Tax=Tuber aestivum TaxID=59557 RepID=A0A292PZI9_9PEZI|nr:unnamed protein product [Tuber aestivum]